MNVDGYLKEGYVVISEGKTFITLKKRKKFNWWLFFLLFGIFYLIYYAANSDKLVTLKK